MRRFKELLLLFFIAIIFTPSVHAFEITSDPQYIVVNFANFYFAKWHAPEDVWQKVEKPKIKQKLRDMKALVTTGNENRKLAWSTLLEYTDFPMDKATTNSDYAIQVKRIMEVAEEENFPVFLPLNGMQWWTQLPELWNYWDPDGDHTAGCHNDEYTKIDAYNGKDPIYHCKFEKLRDPEYRKRFIAGYDPENKWNVEWEDWETPMQFNWRNWGGGDIAVAPPQNFVDHGRNKLSSKRIQTDRFDVILQVIAEKLTQWEKDGKQDLFAGISIGTEISLNASAKKGEDQFRPYGYRALQDTFCPKDQPTCGRDAGWTAKELETMRQQVLFTYINNLTERAARKGLPKQRIYTHVWSEADPGDKKYTNAIGASLTLYSRPGMSLYGKAENPLAFVDLKNALVKNGLQGWAGPEFSPLDHNGESWDAALHNALANPVDPAKLVDIYNERDILGTAAIPQLKKILTEEPTSASCSISEVIPLTPSKSENIEKISWKLLHEDKATEQTVYFSKMLFPQKIDDTLQKVTLTNEAREYAIPKNMPHGLYHWFVKREGCNDAKWTTSTPHSFIYYPPEKEEATPFWVEWILKVWK